MKALDRVDFGSKVAQKDFFVSAKLRSHATSWEQLFAILGSDRRRITFRAFKRWRLGQSLPPQRVVTEICDLVGEDIRAMRLTVRPSNWGARKGGLEKVARCGCNLTLRDRVKGGRIVGRSNSVVRLGHIGSLGGVNSLKSGRNPRRRVLGPLGRTMYNELEKRCFLAMLRAGEGVEYEPVVLIGDRRVVPDFRVGRIYIECTYDRNVSVKAERLVEKFRMLALYRQRIEGIVVTLPHLVDRYRFYLEPKVSVVTLDTLVSRLSGR